MAKKIIDKEMYRLQWSLDKESYEWLAAAAPEVLSAVESEVAAGHTPDEIKLLVIREYGREDFAMRLQQAARHIERARL